MVQHAGKGEESSMRVVIDNKMSVASSGFEIC